MAHSGSEVFLESDHLRGADVIDAEKRVAIDQTSITFQLLQMRKPFPQTVKELFSGLSTEAIARDAIQLLVHVRSISHELLVCEDVFVHEGEQELVTIGTLVEERVRLHFQDDGDDVGSEKLFRVPSMDQA